MKNEIKILKWCYKKDLHRLDEIGRLHIEEFKTDKDLESRWWLIQRVNGPRVKRFE